MMSWLLEVLEAFVWHLRRIPCRFGLHSWVRSLNKDAEMEEWCWCCWWRDRPYWTERPWWRRLWY